MAELKVHFLADLAVACRRLHDVHAQQLAASKQQAARPVRQVGRRLGGSIMRMFVAT